MTKVCIWGGRVLLFAAGAACMWAEGQEQRVPGIGFALGMIFIFCAAIVGNVRVESAE